MAILRDSKVALCIIVILARTVLYLKKMLQSSLGILFFLVLLVSCARVKTIGTKKHNFNNQPRHIVWFQFPGLASEHLALSRFSRSRADQKTDIENHVCLGNMWNFNLFKIRPSAKEGFLSQMTGSTNIKNQCVDYKLTPIWDYFMNSKRISGMIESGVWGGNSIVSSRECYEQNIAFYKNITVWKMDDELMEIAIPFYHQNLGTIDSGKIYYDKSCSKNNCTSDISDNVKAIWKKYFFNERKTLFIIRNFNYLNALKKKDIRKATKVLEELDAIYAYFSRFKNVLVVISGSETRRFELPRKGKDWGLFIKKGRKVTYRDSSLMSPVYAQGPRSEKFCGIFLESQMLKRLSD